MHTRACTHTDTHTLELHARTHALSPTLPQNPIPWCFCGGSPARRLQDRHQMTLNKLQIHQSAFHRYKKKRIRYSLFMSVSLVSHHHHAVYLVGSPAFGQIRIHDQSTDPAALRLRFLPQQIIRPAIKAFACLRFACSSCTLCALCAFRNAVAFE